MFFQYLDNNGELFIGHFNELEKMIRNITLAGKASHKYGGSIKFTAPSYFELYDVKPDKLYAIIIDRGADGVLVKFIEDAEEILSILESRSVPNIEPGKIFYNLF